MQYAHLRAFHMVAREGGFTRAADSLRLSQPTLSAQVKALEEHYRVSLFRRGRRGVALTDLGRALYGVTTRIFALEEEADALLAETGELARGHIRVGADGPFHAVPIMAEFKRRHPGPRQSLTIGNSDEVLRGLFDHRADVAVLANAPDDERLHVIALRRDRVVVFAPADDPWAGRGAIRMADLATREMILREAGSVTRLVFQRALERAGVQPAAVMEIESREAVREAVVAGLGLGVVFESEFGRDDRLIALPVADAALEVREDVVCLKDRRRLRIVAAFLEVAAALAKM